jgi:hypothetical protein
MLYDNSQLARLYLHAWQVTGNEFFRTITEEILDYVMREMTYVGTRANDHSWVTWTSALPWPRLDASYSKPARSGYTPGTMKRRSPRGMA